MDFVAERIAINLKYSGVTVSEDDIRFDFEKDSDNDIIRLAGYRLHGTSLGNNIYWFGYEFEKTASFRQRTDFINYIKGTGDRKISDAVLRKFIEVPMAALSAKINTYRIDTFVYPASGRSQLVSKMLRIIVEFLPNDVDYCSFELVKKTPVDIKFNWKKFEAAFGENPNYLQMAKHVKENILPAIRELDYFSLANSVKPKYRPYITNYLGFPDVSALEEFAGLKGRNILLVDDINTSGSTIREILRILNIVNSQCNIFIYTLLGRKN